MIPGLLEARVIFVGGKGGVGKTTTALALSLVAAGRGKRCLVVSTDPAHSLGDACGRAIGDRVTAIAAGVWGLEVDPDAEARRHIAAVTERMKDFAVPEMHREVERQMALAALSPGAAEAALLERVASLMLEAVDDYDLVIFDTAPTGHTLRLLTLPEAMAAWTDGLLRQTRRSEELGQVLRHLTPSGARADVPTPFDDPQEDPFAGMDRRTRRVAETLLARRRLFHRARRALRDTETTALIFVLTPERLPILETRRAMDALAAFELPVRGLVVNRLLPDEAEGTFLARRRQGERRYLEQIAATFTEVPRVHLPLLAEEIEGLPALDRVAAHLARQL
jgi:arsenite/tail-anchored protein-transporting ATPase